MAAALLAPAASLSVSLISVYSSASKLPRQSDTACSKEVLTVEVRLNSSAGGVFFSMCVWVCVGRRVSPEQAGKRATAM